MKCPYCKSEKILPFLKAKCLNYDIGCIDKESLDKIKEVKLEASLCLHCGLGFNSSPFSDEERMNIYNNYNPVTIRQNPIREPLYEGIFSLICRYLNHHEKIVEIGCSDGYLLSLLKNVGYENCIGIEPSSQAANTARSEGLNIINDYFEPYTFISNDIDGFYLMHVFEHFPDPFSIMRSMKQQLKSTGVIIIEVPFFSYFINQHLYYYNLLFFSNMAKDMELKIVEFQISGSQFLLGSILRIVLTHEDNEKFASVQFAESIEDIIARAQEVQKNFSRRYQDLKIFIKDAKNEELYWWGAGGVSAPALYAVNHELQSCKCVRVIDSSQVKWGHWMPGSDYQVQQYTILNGKKIKNLVIASDYYSSILDTMKNANIKAQKIFVVTVSKEFVV